MCGDFIGPRGLRILDRIGCLEGMHRDASPPIVGTRTLVDWRQCYDGPTPFYGVGADELRAHVLTIGRDRLDYALLDSADRAGAIVHGET